MAVHLYHRKGQGLMYRLDNRYKAKAMKILFVIVVGVFLGWLNTQWDVQGQEVLALHQEKLDLAIAPNTTTVFCQVGEGWFASPLIWPF
jgi:hypothetical protein